MRLDRFDHQKYSFPVTDLGPVDREVIVLLHGFPDDASSVAPLARELSQLGYRVLVPELRGYTATANPRRRIKFRIKELDADLMALIKAAGIRKFHLIGYDWGALLGWYLVDRHKEQIISFSALASPHPRAFLKSILKSRQILYSWYMIFFQLPRVPEFILLRNEGRVLRKALSGRGLPSNDVARVVDRFVANPGLLSGALNWYRAMPFDAFQTLTVGPSPVDTMYLYGDADEFSAGAASLETRNWGAWKVPGRHYPRCRSLVTSKACRGYRKGVL